MSKNSELTRRETSSTAQYTTPTPKRLNRRVESRRRCVRNSQLVGDSLDESEQFFANSKAELRCVGGVNAPVGSRDPVYNSMCCWAIEVGDKWRHNDVIVEKVINIDQKLIYVSKRYVQFPNWRSNPSAVVVS